MDEGPFLFQRPAALKLPEGNGGGGLPSSFGPRRARRAGSYRPSPPSRRLPPAFGWATLRRKGRRTKTAPDRTPWRGNRDGWIKFLSLAECGRPSPACGLRKTPRAAYPGVAFLHFRTWRMGGGGVLWLQGPKVRHF
ncbi:protein kinase [Trypanosoma cruzi]|nr:protein kinase [Trypanosoma cruzi]